MHDAQDHSSIIDPSRTGLVLRQVRLDRGPLLIAQPKQTLGRHGSLPYPSPNNPESQTQSTIKTLIGFPP
jgi:hypothetical protein